MVKYIAQISKLLNLEKLKNDRRTIVFAVCLLISTALWFLNALSKNYTTTLPYPVKYVNPPKNKFLANTPPAKFELHVEGHGFDLLRHKMAFSFSPILINLNTIIQNTSEGNNTLSIRTEDLMRQISSQISKEVSVIDVIPKTITLVFDSLHTKKVKIRPTVNITLQPQYFVSDSISASPAEAEITGPASVLDTLSFIYTEIQTFNEVSSTIQKQVRLIAPENTSTDPNRVMLKVPVEKFTEKELRIPVKIRPGEYTSSLKLFPSEVTVSFMVSLSSYENISETDFNAYVDYIPGKSGNETLEVKIESYPLNIEKLRISPGTVEYLIETN